MTPTAYSLDADDFIRRILANPHDSVCRLVFADWLDETGIAANAAWARYLRLTHEIAQTSLTTPHPSRWDRTLRRVGELVSARWRLPAQTFVDHPEEMLQVLPAKNFDLSLQDVRIDRALFRRVPEFLVSRYLVLPLTVVGDRLAVVMPWDPRSERYAEVNRYLRFHLHGTNVLPMTASLIDCRRAIASLLNLPTEENDEARIRYLVTRMEEAVAGLVATDETNSVAFAEAVLPHLAEAEMEAVELLPRHQHIAVQSERPLLRIEANLNRLLLHTITAGIKTLAGMPIRTVERVQCGTLHYRSNQHVHSFGVRITRTVLGPRLRLTRQQPMPTGSAITHAA